MVPRFFYSNAEMSQRREPVSIGVRSTSPATAAFRERLTRAAGHSRPRTSSRRRRYTPSMVTGRGMLSARRSRVLSLTPLVQNPKSIQRVVALMVPGLTNQMLDLPAQGANPNLPISIPAPEPNVAPKSKVPFVAETFMHACPTRAPGEASKMHSILSAFFMAPVTGEEKKKRILERISRTSPPCLLACLDTDPETPYSRTPE